MYTETKSDAKKNQDVCSKLLVAMTARFCSLCTKLNKTHWLLGDLTAIWEATLSKLHIEWRPELIPLILKLSRHCFIADQDIDVGRCTQSFEVSLKAKELPLLKHCGQSTGQKDPRSLIQSGIRSHLTRFNFKKLSLSLNVLLGTINGHSLNYCPICNSFVARAFEPELPLDTLSFQN